jgi:RHS repeat-associated protein
MRVTTNTGGSIVAQSGHYPYGENWYESGGANKLKFTSYERDAESGNDYAIFRSYISRLGRFSSPDLLRGRFSTPRR